MYPKMGSYHIFCMVRENIKQFDFLPKMQERSGSATEGVTDCRLGKPNVMVTEGSASVEQGLIWLLFKHSSLQGFPFGRIDKRASLCGHNILL